MSNSTAKKGKLNTDESGNLIDPPVIPEHEQRLRAAHDAADEGEIARLTDEYAKEQRKVAQRRADAEANA